MIRKALLTFLMVVMAVGLQSNEIGVTTLRSNAMKGLNVESGYEQEMAAWAYYRINGADGIAKDYNEAIKILKKLVARDESRVNSDKFHYVVEGYNLLGDCYEKGYGVTKDINKAKKYWQLAANYNHADAREKLDQYKSLNNKSNQTFTVNGVSFKMIAVEGGTFRMGSNDSGAYDDEKPIHSVTLSDYYIGETEVTQELWEAVMGTTIRQQRGVFGADWSLYGEGPSYPMYYVSWYECQDFIKKLNQLTGKTFRLPTEAEWEYAARGGNKSRGYKYSGSNSIGAVAWYDVNAYDVGSSDSNYGTHQVGSKSPNELGIYDMSGNLWEWCSDWYSSSYYSSSPSANPTGPHNKEGKYSYRVLRGGSWYSGARRCRVANRDFNSPGRRISDDGFRLALFP